MPFEPTRLHHAGSAPSLLESTSEKRALVKASFDQKPHWAMSEREQAELTLKQRDRELAAKDYNLKQARMLVEEARQARLQAEGERDAMAEQLSLLMTFLLANGKSLDSKTLERVRFFVATFKGNEANVSEDSIKDVAEFSFETQNDLLAEASPMQRIISYSAKMKDQKRRKSHSLGVNLSQHEIRSFTTKVTIDRDGNALAESLIEALPVNANINLKELKKVARKSRESRGERRAASSEDQDAFEVRPLLLDDGTKNWTPEALSGTPFQDNPVLVCRQFSNASSFPNRMHNFLEKQVTMPERCGPCSKKIGFRKRFFLCKNCAAVCHKECRNEVPLPCVPASVPGTSTNKASGNTLADFTPLSPPMVPALLVHCAREIELRGLTEFGIYSVPGSEIEANQLLEKFMRNQGAPPLGRYRIHAIASTMKKFLRSLKEPVIPLSLRRVFVDATCNPDTTDCEAAMYQAVSELPRPNMDTLAFLMLHLQTVASSVECKMPEDNLARVFGPAILGYSSHEPEAMLSEGETQKCTMLALFKISSPYWAIFLKQKENLLPLFSTPVGRHQKSPGITRKTRLFGKQQDSMNLRT